MRFLTITLGCVSAILLENASADEGANVVEPQPSTTSCSEIEALAQTIKGERDACLRDYNTVAAQSQVCVKQNEEWRVAYDKLSGEFTQCKTTIDSQTAQLASCADSKALRDQLKNVESERDRLAKENVRIAQANKDLSTEISVTRSKAQEEKTINSGQLQECLAAKTTVEGNFVQMKNQCDKTIQSYKSQVDHLISEGRKHVSDLEAKKQKLERSLHDTQYIYSAPQFWRHVDHSKAIGRAFVTFAKNRLINLIGSDTYNLVSLQVKVWYVKLMKSVVNPAHHQVSTYYQKLAKKHVDILSGLVYRYSELPLDKLKSLVNRLLIFTDAYMERVIKNLASVDKSVEVLFPKDFHDRCYAFAFVALLIYITSQATQYVFQLLWSGLTRCFSSGKKKKQSSSKKSAGSSGKKSNMTKVK